MIKSISCVALGIFFLTASVVHAEEKFPLTVRIILGKKTGNEVDPRLKDLVREFGALKFSSYSLHHEAHFDLQTGAAARVGLTDGTSAQVLVKGLAGERLRLEISVEKKNIKATVAVAAGATVVIRGPDIPNGAMIIVITRPTTEPTAP